MIARLTLALLLRLVDRYHTCKICSFCFYRRLHGYFIYNYFILFCLSERSCSVAICPSCLQKSRWSLHKHPTCLVVMETGSRHCVSRMLERNGSPRAASTVATGPRSERESNTWPKWLLKFMKIFESRIAPTRVKPWTQFFGWRS